VDGVKILNHQDDSWILILPDAGEPLVHLFANSNDREWVDQTLRPHPCSSLLNTNGVEASNTQQSVLS